MPDSHSYALSSVAMSGGEACDGVFGRWAADRRLPSGGCVSDVSAAAGISARHVTAAARSQLRGTRD
jgi:hypothetical protein